MKLEVIKEGKTFLELKFDEDAHTILNILKKKLLEDSSVEFTGYNKPHPLKNESVLVIRTKRKSPKKVLKEALNDVIKDLESLKL